MGPTGPGPSVTRRLALKGLGGLGAAALGVTGCTDRDPAGPAVTTAATARAARPAGTLLWHARVPGGIISLVATDGLLCAGVHNGTSIRGVYAMQAGTGREAWAHYGDAVAIPYAAQAGVLFGDSFAGIGALRASDGKGLWTAPAGTVNLGSASTWVLVTGGTVCTTADLGGIQKLTGVVLGLDTGTGQRKWTAGFPSDPTGLTSAAGLVFAGSPAPPFKQPSGKVAALDAATGQRRWTSADLRIIPGEIAATQTTVAVSTSLLLSNPGKYVTLGLDAATGHELWRTDGAAYPLTAAGEHIYGVTRTLWGRDARTGRQVWDRAVGPRLYLLTATDDVVLAASRHTVYALSATDGHQLWSRTLPVYPTIITTADDVVYVAATSNPLGGNGADEVYAFQA